MPRRGTNHGARLLVAAAATAVLVVPALSACGGTGDDVARAARGPARETLVEITTSFRGLWRSLRGQADNAAQYARSVRQVADDYELSPEVEEAVTSLMIQVSCDYARGNIPLDNLSDYILQNAAVFGLSVTFEGADVLADDIVATWNGSPATTDEVCSLVSTLSSA